MIFVSGVKDYKRLKSDETSRLSLNWNLNREISKLNYRIHTDAIKENLFPYELTAKQMSFTYADEAGSERMVLLRELVMQQLQTLAAVSTNNLSRIEGNV